VGLLAFNVEMNPQSAFAQRQYARVRRARVHGAGWDSGAAVYQRVKAQFGQPRETEDCSMHRPPAAEGDKTEAAIAAFKLNTTSTPRRGRIREPRRGLLEARRQEVGDRELPEAVELDSTNTNAVQQLETLKVSKKKIASARQHR